MTSDRGASGEPGDDVVMARTITWAGEDDPHRLDVAHARLDGTRLTAHGTQLNREWSLAWALECDEGWVTRAMRVSVLGREWSRTLDLRHDGTGVWTAEASAAGSLDLPGPGITDAAALADALDCDLALCPLTNVMPIRRLGLTAGPVAEQVLTMAWIDVPSLQVVPSVQRYSSTGPGRVRYESEQRDFRADLTLDDDGFVIDYPALARRVELT